MFAFEFLLRFVLCGQMGCESFATAFAFAIAISIFIFIFIKQQVFNAAAQQLSPNTLAGSELYARPYSQQKRKILAAAVVENFLILLRWKNNKIKAWRWLLASCFFFCSLKCAPGEMFCAFQ